MALRSLCSKIEFLWRASPPFRRHLAVASVASAAILSPLYLAHRSRSAADSKRRLYSQAIKDLVFLDFAVGSRYVGRVLIGLYSDRVPLSAENFMQLCQGFRVRDKFIGYRNTQVHRIQQGVALLAGDVLTGKGGNGLSIYGSRFPDENFSTEFLQDGDVAFVSQGPNSNNSQFMITLCPLPVLNRQHVVVGTVLKGMRVIRRIEDVGTKNGIPMEPVKIIGSGVYRGLDDGPPFFSSPDLLESLEQPPLAEKPFLQLPAEEQQQLIQQLKTAATHGKGDDGGSSGTGDKQKSSK